MAHWVATVADGRIHETTHERPADRRAAAVAACTPWSATRPFWYGEEIVRPVYADGCLRWHGHTWAVGYDYIGPDVIVQRRLGGGMAIRWEDPEPTTPHALIGDPGPICVWSRDTHAPVTGHPHQ